ncbi:4578_t:CDS:2 [Funneliformis caledonium]|uniref:4578_t:CDS:1 n=1 Tax=Funneliformis caledonium TaxID=1117310 RepID=A0A9N9FCW6_9GLOM|nr:4578_t:CDS:2 [Funneliformis caledonium]
MRNEKANPLVKAHIRRKVDMKDILIRTFNKFEVLYRKVTNRLSSLGVSFASQKKKYLDKVKLAVLIRDSLNSGQIFNVDHLSEFCYMTDLSHSI